MTGFVFRRLKLLRRVSGSLVAWDLDVVSISDLCKFNVRYFLMVYDGAIVIRGVARELGEVVHVSYWD